MTGRDFAIGVLSVTAVILLVGLLVLQAGSPQAAMAIGQSGTVGNYVVATCQVDDQAEILSILDTTAQRLNFYRLDLMTNQLLPIRSIDVRVQPGAGRNPRRR